MAEDPSTAVWTTVISAAATILAVILGARYTAKATVAENRRQYDETKAAQRRANAVEVAQRIDAIRSALSSALTLAEVYSLDPTNKGGVVIGMNIINDDLASKGAALSVDAAKNIQLYRQYHTSASRFEGMHFAGNWNETRHTQIAWCATLNLQAHDVAKAVAASVGLPKPVTTWAWRRKMRKLKRQLPSEWKRDAGI